MKEASSTVAAPAGASASEARLVLLMAAIQFVNVLDFVMVMPLGPDFAIALDIPVSQIGIIGGAYTLAAAVSGVVGSFFLDRFDRRSALAVAMAGLVLATFAGGLAGGMISLVASRVVAGMFGGPATSLALAVVTDAVPSQRRGRAIGTVIAAFSVASVLGVPAGLELARLLGWRAPFFSVSALGLVVTALAMTLLPPLRGHLMTPARTADTRDGVATASVEFPVATASIAPSSRRVLDRLSILSLCNTFVVTFGVFLVVPNISAFFQYNLGYPREHLGLLYLVGGIGSFIALKVVGNLVDEFGATRFVIVGTVLHVAALWFGFVKPEFGAPAMLIFVTFMLSGSVRMVPNAWLATRVPRSDRRASFMSAQSAVRHISSALGAMLSAFVLLTEPGGRLLRMEWIASTALVFALLGPLLTARVEARVLKRESRGDADGAGAS